MKYSDTQLAEAWGSIIVYKLPCCGGINRAYNLQIAPGMPGRRQYAVPYKENLKGMRQGVEYFTVNGLASAKRQNKFGVFIGFQVSRNPETNHLAATI